LAVEFQTETSQSNTIIIVCQFQSIDKLDRVGSQSENTSDGRNFPGEFSTDRHHSIGTLSLLLERGRLFFKGLPRISSIERRYGSAVSMIFQVHRRLFLMNVATLLLWLGSMTIPYQLVRSDQSSSSFASNQSSSSSSSSYSSAFHLASLFTSQGYLEHSLFFIGSYSPDVTKGRYNLPLIYLVMSYAYFLVWLIYLATRYADSYRQKLLKTILTTKTSRGFTITFALFDFSIMSMKERSKQQITYSRQYQDLFTINEQNAMINSRRTQTRQYKAKLLVTNLFYAVLPVSLGKSKIFSVDNRSFVCARSDQLGMINWLLLRSCGRYPVNCWPSIVFMVFINRLVPYAIVLLTQVEQRNHSSSLLDVIGFR
jgi:hypothetical protein